MRLMTTAQRKTFSPKANTATDNMSTFHGHPTAVDGRGSFSSGR